MLNKNMRNKNVLNKNSLSNFLLIIALIELLTSCAELTSTTRSKPTVEQKTIYEYQSVKSKQLINITAQFTTSTANTRTATADAHWRLLRERGRVELLHLNSNTSEIWNETSNDLWFYQKVFHNDQQVIEYSPVDLKVLGMQPQWLSLALAINPRVLSAMGAGKPDKSFYGWKTEKYKGQIKGATYEVLWLPELAIAARVKCTEAGITSTTEMQKPFLMAESPWQTINISGYRLIDYSDLGDMERDPFVIKIQGDILGGHDYKH